MLERKQIRSGDLLAADPGQDERTPPGSSAHLDAGERKLCAALSSRLSTSSLVIAFGNDDYTRVTGGIQVCVGEEQHRLNQAGQDYVYCFPRAQQQSLQAPGTDPPIRLSVNGSLLPGDLRISALTTFLARLQSTGTVDPSRMTFVIHGLLGHSPEAIAHCITSVPGSTSLLWIHDYFSLCSSPQLAYDELVYCGAPHHASSACLTCNRGSLRESHLSRMEHLINTVRPRVIAPSNCAATTFTRAARSSGCTGLQLDIDVLPHGTIEWFGEGPVISEGEPVTVVFVGLPLPHKGWLVFHALAQALGDDPRYRFVHVGAERTDNITHVPLHQTGAYSAVATAVLRDIGAHALFAWSQWPETFHIVSQEAMAAGCVVVTSPASGNVYDSALHYGRLVAFDTVETLWQSFSDGSARDAIVALHRKDRRVGEFIFTGLTSAALTIA